MLALGIIIIVLLVGYPLIGILFAKGLDHKIEDPIHKSYFKTVKLHLVMYYWQMLTNVHRIHASNREISNKCMDDIIEDSCLLFAQIYGESFKKDQNIKKLGLYVFAKAIL